jgi:hypothetical protein
VVFHSLDLVHYITKITGILPSGYDIASWPWKDPPFYPFLRTVNHLFLWAMASMANWQCHNQRVDVFLEQIIQKSVAHQHVPMRMASLGTELC